MYIAVAAIMLLVGIILFALGLRGRKVDDHLHCASCRFDLTGRHPDVQQCPECGEPIDEPRHIRTQTDPLPRSSRSRL